MRLTLKSHLLGAVTASIGLSASSASGQTVATSFEELERILRTGQTIEVVDAGGQRTRGKIADLAGASLVILVPATRTFTEADVVEIRAIDRLWNGALVGAAIGAGLATWDYLIDPSEPGNAAVYAIAIGLGTAIGAGIDTLVNRGGRPLYAAPPQRRTPLISLVLGNHRRAALVSVRF